MANYSAADAAGQIYPIVGTGIGLGLLAGMSRNVMDTMYGRRTYRPPPRARTRPRQNPFYPQRRVSYRPPARYRRPQYGYWRY